MSMLTATISTTIAATMPRSVRRTVPFGQALILAALPHGGQRGARRNAWGGMSVEASRGRLRRDADMATRQASDQAWNQASLGSWAVRADSQ